MSDILEIIQKHQSPTPSKWREKAVGRRENKEWLRVSQYFAMFVLGVMDEKKITQKSLALKMGCSQQYISKILKGTENLSIDTITKTLKAIDADNLSVLSFVLDRLSEQNLMSLMDEIQRKRMLPSHE